MTTVRHSRSFVPAHIFLKVGTSPGSVCTLAGTALTKKSSIMVCDSFQVNILLVSPDKKWITAGSKDNVDSSLKVCLCVAGQRLNGV